MTWTRRRVLGAGAFTAAALAVGAPAHAAPPTTLSDDPWRYADAVARRVRAHRPRFPRRRLAVTDFGAVGDGRTDCTRAFAAAIARCAALGGGHVVVPAGVYLTGAIRLRSRVDLHVEEGATVRFSTDTTKYPLVFSRWQGVECMNYSPFIYAYGAHDIAVTGRGTLDGQASNSAWWPWKGREEYGWEPGQPNQDADWALLQQMADAGTPVRERVFGQGHYLRPNFVQPYRCRRVLVEGVTVLSSPMWEIHPVLSESVWVRDLTVVTHGPNNDGCNPESCTDVLIEDCLFDTGDDCIAIKAGRNADGRRVNVPSRNIVIRDSEFRDGHGGVTMGSEMTGGVSAVFASNLRMSSPNLNDCLRLKTNSVRGGYIHDVYMRDIEVGELAVAGLEIDFNYEEGGGHPYLPDVRNINMTRVHVQTTKYALDLQGYENDHIHGVTLRDCTFDHAAEPNVIRYVDDLKLINVTINGEPATATAA